MKSNWFVTTIVVVVAILGLIYVGGLGTLRNKTVDGKDTDPLPLKTITASRTFSNGKHTVTGVIDLPTPCHALSIDATVTESYPEQVALNFNSSTTAETCAQVVTPVEFKEEFNASGYAIIRAFWNGEPAKLEFTN